MTHRWIRWLVTLVAGLFLLVPAQAAITCTSVSSPGASLNYVNGTTMSVQTYFTVSCTRGSTADPTSATYSVLADNGTNPQGQNNRATYTGATLRYDVYTDATCGTQWKGARAISDTITWAAGATGTISKQTSFRACIVTAQTLTLSGNYTDSVVMTMTYNNVSRTGTIPISIFAPAICTMTTPPGNITMSYAAFGPLVARTTTFSVTCTSGMPYTMATDVTESVLTGLRYILGLSTASTSGTGLVQSHTITATIPAGQAGTCNTSSCVGSNTHTLTITY